MNNDEKILAALVSCGSIRKASKASGITEYAIRQRLLNGEFRAKYDEIKSNLLREACDNLTAKLTLAINTLCDVAEDEKQSAQIRVSASDSILRHGLRYIEAANIIARIEKIEEKLRSEEQ